MFLVASADICSLEPSSLSLWTSSFSDRQSPSRPRKQPNKRARKLTYMQTSLHTCLHACTPTYIHVRSSIQCANARMSRHSIYITTCVLLRVHKCLSCPRLSASLFLLSSHFAGLFFLCFVIAFCLRLFFFSLVTAFCLSLLFFHFSFLSCSFFFF